MSTLAKLFAADYWIVLDDVQFTRRDYQHRARLSALHAPHQQQWLTLPTHLPQGRPTLIRDAELVDPERSRRRVWHLLKHHYGTSQHWPPFQQAFAPLLDLFNSTDKTADIAEASARLLLDYVGWDKPILRSSRIPSRPERSQRLADLASATKARAYLCGPGGGRYLRAEPFRAEGITIISYRTPAGELWEAGRRTSALTTLMTVGPAALAGILTAAVHGHCG